MNGLSTKISGLPYTQDPFEGVSIAASTASGPIGAAMVESNQELLFPSFERNTVVIPNLDKVPVAMMQQGVTGLINGRLGHNRTFYILTESGDEVFRRNAESKFLMEPICGFDPNIASKMARSQMMPLTHRHLDNLGRILNLKPGSLLIETGAGADYGRIERLAQCVNTIGGEMICHDIPTLAAKMSIGNIPDGIPYFALPTERDYFESLLRRVAPIETPKVVSLQNVISVCSFDAVSQLFQNANAGAIDRVVIQQSLLAALETEMLPVRFKPGKRGAVFDVLVDSVLASEGLVNPEDPFYRLARQKAINVITTSLTELMVRHTLDEAAKNGFTHSQVYFVTEGINFDRKSFGEQFGTESSIGIAAAERSLGAFKLGPFSTSLQWSPQGSAEEIVHEDTRLVIEVGRQLLERPFHRDNPRVRYVDLSKETLMCGRPTSIGDDFITVSAGFPHSVVDNELIRKAHGIGMNIAKTFLRLCLTSTEETAEQRLNALRPVVERHIDPFTSYLR